MYFFNLYFSTVHISINNVISRLKFCMHVRNIAVKGTMSQNFFLSLSFYFMSKNGQLFIYFLHIFFLDFLEKKLGPI